MTRLSSCVCTCGDVRRVTKATRRGLRRLVALLLSFCAAVLPFGAEAQDNTIRIKLDASDAPRRLFHVQMTIPAKPGPMTLLYPQWIPGEHGPTGPITDLVGLRID